MGFKVGFVGCGNMGYAICSQLLSSGVYHPKDVAVSDRNTGGNIQRIEKLNVGLITSANQRIFSECEIVWIALKPKDFRAMVNATNPSLIPSKKILVVSIMSGISTQLIKEVFSSWSWRGHSVSVIRIVINLPITVGHGCAAFCRSANTSDSDFCLIKSQMSSLCLCEEIPETLMNSAAAVFGCGPAFASVFIEALSDGGVKAGLPRELALKFAAQMTMSTSNMILKNKIHPAVLKDQVCSPGGTSIEGVHALERGGFRASTIEAVEAAFQRSQTQAKTDL